jgi:hypothetical protein
MNAFDIWAKNLLSLAATSASLETSFGKAAPRNSVRRVVQKVSCGRRQESVCWTVMQRNSSTEFASPRDRGLDTRPSGQVLHTLRDAETKPVAAPQAAPTAIEHADLATLRRDADRTILLLAGTRRTMLRGTLRAESAR